MTDKVKNDAKPEVKKENQNPVNVVKKGNSGKKGGHKFRSNKQENLYSKFEGRESTLKGFIFDLQRNPNQYLKTIKEFAA